MMQALTHCEVAMMLLSRFVIFFLSKELLEAKLMSCHEILSRQVAWLADGLYNYRKSVIYEQIIL